MSTVADLMDRLYLEWLYQADDRPVEVEITDDPLTATSETITLAAGLTPEEQNLLAAGTRSELEDELVRAIDYDPPSRILTARRGDLGTTKAQHAKGTILTVAPTFPRKVVFDVVADVIVGLSELWTPKTEIVYTEAITEIEDGTASGVVSVKDLDGFDVNFTPMLNYADVDSGVAIRFDRADCGQEAIVVYSVPTLRPSAKTDELSALNVSEAWQEVLIISAASRLLRGKEVDKATIQFLTEALETAGVRLGEITDVATALLRYRELLVSKLAADLYSRVDVGTTMTRVI